MNVTYSMQLIAGMLVFTMGAYFFAERAAQRGHGEESVARTPFGAEARVGSRSSPSGPAGIGHVSLSHPVRDSRPDSGSGVDHPRFSSATRRLAPGLARRASGITPPGSQYLGSA